MFKYVYMTWPRSMEAGNRYIEQGLSTIISLNHRITHSEKNISSQGFKELASKDEMISQVLVSCCGMYDL